MRSVQIAMLAGLLLLAGLVAWLALRNPQPPFLPADADHARFINAGRCLSCHGPQGESPQPANHPLGNDCLRCHGRP